MYVTNDDNVAVSPFRSVSRSLKATIVFFQNYIKYIIYTLVIVNMDKP